MPQNVFETLISRVARRGGQWFGRRLWLSHICTMTPQMKHILSEASRLPHATARVEPRGPAVAAPALSRRPSRTRLARRLDLAATDCWPYLRVRTARRFS